MTETRLAQLANAIGQFFEAFADRAEAEAGVATHLRKFWDPRMRHGLYAYLDGAAAGAALSELVRASIITHRATLEPNPGPSMTSPPPPTP